MKVYKLTDEDDQTFNDTQWSAGTEHTADGKSKDLCNNHWIHAYPTPELAVLMNPVHANFTNAHLWECDADVGLVLSDKLGCTRLRTIKQIPLPVITIEQSVRFGILCAISVYDTWSASDTNAAWITWARAWLSGGSPSTASAVRSAESAWAASAGMAAYRSAESAVAAGMAESAVWAAAVWAAAGMAAEAGMAAYRSAESAVAIDLVALANQAIAEG